MSEFDGYVLRGARTSPSNATTSAPADSGVTRDVRTLDPSVYPTGQPPLVEARADQYRAAVLHSPMGEQEWLVWAANSASITTLEGTEWATTQGRGSIPSGSTPVFDTNSPTGQSSDGSARVIIVDDGGRDVGGVVSIRVRRGDGGSFLLTEAAGDFSFNITSGALTLLPTATTLAATQPVDPAEPALSLTRGDQVQEVTYWVAAPRFWWTRNDAYTRRFGWNGASQKWEPFRGGSPIDLGVLSSDGRTYSLTPRPTSPTGTFLPGSEGDAYAMLRLGAAPDASSYAIVQRSVGDFSGILVVPDDLADANFNFAVSSPPLAGVVGSAAGKILWNPAFVQAYEGLTVWYLPRTFTEKSTGVVGKLLDAKTKPLFIAPVPGPGERPVVRIGNRAPLRVIPCDTEADLLAATVLEGEVAFAISTGRLKFALDDIAKADPGTRAIPNPDFDPLYLGSVIRYDGITLNLVPQPLKAPTPLLDASGDPVTSYDPTQDVFIPDALTLPGLGVSGILQVPDGLGNSPTSGVVGPRPNTTGLIRKLSPGFGDVIVFSPGRAITNIIPVAFEDDLPTDLFRVHGDAAYVALEKQPGLGSRILFGSVPRQQLAGKPLYFLQSEFIPSTLADRARLISRLRDSFVLQGTETLTFQIGLVTVVWSASTLGEGTHPANTVAASLNEAIHAASASGSAYTLSGHLVIAADDALAGHIAIGFGTGGTLDLSGCAALGFLPGWVASPPIDLQWNADFGGGFGFHRSPQDLNGQQGISSYRDKYRVEDRTLTESVSGTPYQFLDYAPREDIAGYDDGVFFTLSAAGAPGLAPVIAAPLRPWRDVRYLFEEKKFAWIGPASVSGQVQEPVAGINLGVGGVVGESFIAPLNGFLRLSDGGPFEYLEPGEDFLLPQSGTTGEAVLVHRVGGHKLTGYRGRFAQGSTTLTDVGANFSHVQEGDRLKILSGAAQGSYHVVATLSTTSVEVNPPFPEGDGGRNISYEIFQGVAPGNIDPSVIADVTFQDFDHLAEEPFEIRVLTRLGVGGSTLAPADATKSIELAKPIFVRAGQTGKDIPLRVLERAVLGTLANNTLAVPTTNPRFSSGAFDLRIGTWEFKQGVDLLPVATFSPDPTTTIEYLTTTGELKFGSAILDEFAFATVVYVETLLSSSNLLAGQAEIDPDTGAIAVSAADMIVGEPIYYVEQRDTEGSTDVIANPILGSFTFLANPIREGQLVEATYYRAVPETGDLFTDSNGNPVQVREFLPLFVRAEIATRVSNQLYRFNPSGRTTDPTVAPSVYAGARQLTYSIKPECAVDFTRNTISLSREVHPDTKVTISYAVLEAFGGETSYTVSQPPVWRPPFHLAKGQSHFLLDEDRTGDVVPGKALRIGAFTTYITDSQYDAPSKTTLVTVDPAPSTGAGSLNPGQNALTLITDRPIVGDSGFLPTMAQAFGATPKFESAAKGQVEIKFEGDITRYAVAGHLLELFGHPFVIGKANLSSDGRTTTITTLSPFPQDFVWSAGLPASAVRISVRPVYPEGSAQFLGHGAFVPTEPFEVVLFEAGQPGRTLVLGRDYTVTEGNGNIAFIEPRQPGLGAGQRLMFARTDVRQVRPFVSKGQVQYPRLASRFSHIAPPSERNGRLGGILQATYTFEVPDTFYVRALPLRDFVGETALDIQREAAAQEPATGPVFSSGASKSNSDKGRAGLVTERQNLLDRDRVARTFLGFFNAVVGSFEQIEETFNGELVGERDGKLRLYVGKHDPWTPPGYEDEITGVLNPRVLWFEAWNAARVGLPTIRLLPSDPVIEPLTASTDANGRPIGQFQDAASFSALLNFQEQLIKNDVDDIVLIGRKGVVRKAAGSLGILDISFKVTAHGQYAHMSEPGPFSRLFPERTEAFTTIGPGLDADEATGYPGVFSAGKIGFDPLGFLFGAPFSIRSTNGKTIGTLENPVLGQIENVLGMRARDRHARARIWSYSPTGFPETDPLSAGRPCFIATPLPLVDFPILSDTGLPDTSQLFSQSGSKYDLLTGDPHLHTPPFASGDQLAVGYPKGNAQELGYVSTSIPVGTSARFAGVFVDDVLQGCIITLKSKDLTGADVPILDSTLLVALTSPTTGESLEVGRGDSIFVIPNTGATLPATSDPPTIDELQLLTAALPEYRTGTDLNFISRTGEIVDATLPSFADPTLFGLKEITGQRPPAPMSTLEATVSFQNGARLPIRFPALDGGKTLDSGDYSLPYYGTALSELELLGDAASVINELIRSDSPDPPPANPPAVLPYFTEAIFPDETLGEGLVNSSDSATLGVLLTSADLSRRTTSGAYPPPPGRAGVGDVEPYDLLLIQEGTGSPSLPPGATGIHSIGSIQVFAPAQVEPPRFATFVPQNSGFTYAIENLLGWVGYPAYAEGVVVTEEFTGALYHMTFDLSSVGSSNIVLDDGVGGGSLPTPVGGFNDLFSGGSKGSRLYIRLIEKATGEFVPSTTLILEVAGGGVDILSTTFVVSGDDGSTWTGVDPGSLKFTQGILEFDVDAQVFDFTPFDLQTPTPDIRRTGGFHDFTFSVEIITSPTASIDPDRLTFHECVDFRTALPRDFTHPSSPTGSNMECRLVTASFETAVFDTTAGFAIVSRPNLANHIDFVNGATPFTFPARDWIAPSTYGVGTWSGGRGSLRAVGFEGHGNVAIDATNITFTAIPSSRQDGDGAIFNGIMFVGEVATGYPILTQNAFYPFSTETGALTNVEPGDIAVIKGVFDPTIFPTNNRGSGKVGTYLVRAVVPPGSSPGHRIDLVTSAGSGGGWLSFRFPQVVEFDGTDLTVTSLLPLTHLQDINAAPVGSPSAFPTNGRVFIVMNPTAVGTAASAVSASYSGLDMGTNRFLSLVDFRDGVGNPISPLQFASAAVAGRNVSGMTLLPVRPSDANVAPNLPGVTFGPTPSPGSEYFFGFREVTASSSMGSVTFNAGVGDLVAVSPSPAQIAIFSKVRVASTSFIPLEEPVYDEIPGALDISEFPWATLHGAGPDCVLPGDTWTLQYHAKSGLYVEPSFPVSGNDLAASRVNVVDAANSLTSSEIGMRDASTYLPGGGPPGGSYLEFAQVEVRRIRRFHDLQTHLVEALRKLRLIYEIRRGIVQSLSDAGSVGVLVAEPVDDQRFPEPSLGGTATQMGNFPSAGVRTGDQVRFLDSFGAVVAKADVIAVEEQTLTISKNALTNVVSGSRFEVFLRTAPIPHEQSCEELLALATDRVLLERRADMVTQQGGHVSYVSDPDPQEAYDRSINTLRDTNSNIDFVLLGVQEGDVLLIDPAGNLRGPSGFPDRVERGMRPFGDDGVASRGAPIYDPGSPSRTDDNRGYYRVASVQSDHLEVEPLVGTFAGDRSSGDVVFDGYTIYPTVHGSNLSGSGDGIEGQMDLRPTAFADPTTNSFRGNWLSIAPFSYRILRPTTLLSSEAIELILMIRERLLSWIDELRAAFEADKGGGYFTFQRDRHITELGDLADVEAGLGVLFNAFVAEIEGRVDVSPFANTRDGLSILDRRFWGLDLRLDYLRPPFDPFAPPYADFASGAGRPVLPDRIEEVLQQRDRLREVRWAWVTLRADRVSGTLEAIRRFDAELPRRRAEQARALTLVTTTAKLAPKA